MADDQSEVDKVLLSHNKRINEATGILSKVFRKILVELNVTPLKWNVLMNAYLDDPRNRVQRNSKARSSTRGNLNKELSKPSMTWLNFQKGIKFLRPKKAVFKMEFEWHGGLETFHELTIVDESKELEIEESDDE